MNESRFIALARAFGSDRRRWPAQERSKAQLCPTTSPEVEVVLEQERWLDFQLDYLKASAPSADLQRRLATSAVLYRQSVTHIRRWFMAAGAVTALGTGTLTGAATMSLAPQMLFASSEMWGFTHLYDRTALDDLAALGDTPSTMARP